jgi:ParB family transcriptional regulator, chromosome partitioning protein
MTDTSTIVMFDHAMVPLNALQVSPLNVRKFDAKSVGALADSISVAGLLQSLLVRKNSTGYEIIEGQRRYRALCKLAGETAEIDIPCLVVPADMDDATAIHASLEANEQRKGLDAFDRFAAVAAIVKDGRSESDVAKSLRMTPAQVRQTLALARLIPAVQKLYRSEHIDDNELQILTMATKVQQKSYCDLIGTNGQIRSYNLKAWILGTAVAIPTTSALFDIEAYNGRIDTDLFAEERYFGDAAMFWQLQNAAITKQRDELLAGGWSDVVVFAPDQPYNGFSYVTATKAQGGAVHIDVERDGTITIHKGRATAARVAKAQRAAACADGTGAVPVIGEPDAPERAEMTISLANYVDNIRLSAVRAKLLTQPGVALPLLLAHLIAGNTTNITTRAEPAQKLTAAAEAAVAAMESETALTDARERALALIGIDLKGTLVGQRYKGATALQLFEKLMRVNARDLRFIMCVVMAETLGLGSAIVDAAGTQMEVDATSFWTVDDAMLAFVRDREILDKALEAVAGPDVAAAHVAETGPQKRARIKASLIGAALPWCPPWLEFPMRTFTDRPAVGHARPAA